MRSCRRLQTPLAAVAPAQPEPYVYSADDVIWRITMTRRFTALLMSLFGLVGALIGAAGIYAVMAAVVAQKTREIGVRPGARGDIARCAARPDPGSGALASRCGSRNWPAGRVVAVARIHGVAVPSHAGGMCRSTLASRPCFALSGLADRAHPLTPSSASRSDHLSSRAIANSQISKRAGHRKMHPAPIVS